MHPYVDFALQSDPILASSLGNTDYDAELTDVAASAIDAGQRQRRRLLSDAEANSNVGEPGSLPWLDHQALLLQLRTDVRRDEDLHITSRAPYWYAEQLGAALSAVMTEDPAALAAKTAALQSRLRQIPGYLAEARKNLEPASGSIPEPWAEMGITASAGLVEFLATSLPGYAASLPSDVAATLTDGLAAATEAARNYTAFVSELGGSGDQSWPAGTEHVDYLLTNYQVLDLTSGKLLDLGRAKVQEDTERLREAASRREAGVPWQEQISRIKDRHPQPAEFQSCYGDEMVRSLAHTRKLDLISIPDGESCVMGWVPAYRVASLPIAVMACTPVLAPGLHSQWLITPSDPNAPEHRRQQQMRDNCYVFAESIAGHETYPGHHLQQVHHKVNTEPGSIRRFVRVPQFLEGWGLYIEDLFEETGFMDNDDVLLFKYRNALWRSLRIVIDVGLHTGALSFDEAVQLLEQQAGMDTHMATGEVRRYSRHDNATYPSSYVLGKDKFHELRAEWEATAGPDRRLREYHDKVLSYGTLPLNLVRQAMFAKTSNGVN